MGEIDASHQRWQGDDIKQECKLQEHHLRVTKRHKYLETQCPKVPQNLTDVVVIEENTSLVAGPRPCWQCTKVSHSIMIMTEDFVSDGRE